MEKVICTNLVNAGNITNVLLGQASNLKPSDRTINLPIYVSLIKSRNFIPKYTVDDIKWMYILNIINYSTMSLLIPHLKN